MSVTPEQVEQLMTASNTVGEPNQTPATVNELDRQDQIAAALKNPSGVVPITPTLGGPAPSSPTNAAPTPDFRGAGFRGTFADKLAMASSSLIKGGVDPMTAIVAGSLHALHPDSDTPFGTTPFEVATRPDRSQPTTPPPAQPNNAQRIVRGIEGGLGDLAAATEGGPEGGGITGAARVARASTARRREEQENAIKMATANTQMLHEQMLIHRLGEEEVEKSAAAGRQSLDEALMAPGAEVLAQNKTAEELTKMINSKALDPSKDAVFLTGRRAVGQDKNGVPIMQSIYTIVKPGGRISPTQTQIDWLNKYIPGSNFKAPDENSEGGQTFDSYTWYMLKQRGMNNMAAVQTIQKVADENEERAHKIALEKGNDQFVSNPAILHAFNAVPHTGKYDPFLAVKAFQELQREVGANPEILKTLPKNWAEQFTYTYGGGDPKKFEDQVNKYGTITEKIQDAQHDALQSYLDDPSKFNNTTAGIIVAANGVIARVKSENPGGQYTDDQKERIARAEHAKSMALSQAQEEARQKGEESRARDVAKEDVETKGTNGSTEVGEVFLATLSPARRRTIEGFHDGTSTYTPRMGGGKFGQGILRDLRQAYGQDWDETKGQAYSTARIDFTKGKPATAIEAANTSMHHIAGMWQHLDNGAVTGTIGQFGKALHINAEDRALADDAKAVATELGRLYTGGVIGEKDQKEWADKLDPDVFNRTANDLRINIKEFMKLLGGKLEALQTRWDDAAPSSSTHFDKGIISKDNLENFQRITGSSLNIRDTQRVQQYKDQTPASQAGGSQQFQGKIGVTAGGKVHYFNTQAEADNFKKLAGIQ